MKKHPRWNIFKPQWGDGKWVAWHPLQGAHYFQTHAEAWAFVHGRMQAAARINTFKKHVKETYK